MQLNKFILVVAILALSLIAAAHPAVLEPGISAPVQSVLRNIKDSKIRYARPIPGQRKIPPKRR